MTTINFKNIRSTPTSQRDSFEALSVQLFRKCAKIPTNSSFISLRGDGGDGGVEAYFRTPTDTVIGVQAKYFFKLDAPELTQIADSLSAALSNHPTLAEYNIYIPFDLTGRVAAGKRGKSQAERFEEWKTKVESAAAESGRPLLIILATAASIQSQLQEIDIYGGVRRYWFDETTITSHQIGHLLQQAIEFAGPRYTADLDIETHAHTVLDIFSGIGDYHTWVNESLEPHISRLQSTHDYGEESLQILPEEDRTKTAALLDELLALLNVLENESQMSPALARLSCSSNSHRYSANIGHCRKLLSSNSTAQIPIPLAFVNFMLSTTYHFLRKEWTALAHTKRCATN